MSAADDALDVARFVRPGVKVEETSCLGVWGARYEDGEEWFPSHRDIAAAERVLVERGMGQWYGLALAYELGWSGKYWQPTFKANECASFEATGDMLAEIRTAPLEVCLRALARVAREQQTKAPR